MENDFEYCAPYWKWLERKLNTTSGPIAILQRRTMNTATMILSRLRDIPFSEMSASLYFYIKDIEMQKFAHLYEAQLELAGAAPEKFAKGLHRFYNAMTLKIKKENLYRDYFDFLALSTRMRLNAIHQNTQVNKKIIDCYQSLLLQNMEYMRPNKFDFATKVCGLTTDGGLMTGPEPYPFLDQPTYELERDLKNGRISSKQQLEKSISQRFDRVGIPGISTLEQIDSLTNIDKLHTNQIVAMLPMINEFTYDLVPVKLFTTETEPFFTLQVTEPSTDQLKEMLRHRNRTVPSNGVVFQFRPGGLIEKVRMKEILYDDSIYMLYRIETKEGDLSGYYDTQNGYLHSIFLNASNLEPHERIQQFLLYLYACATTREGGKLLKRMPETCWYISDDISCFFHPMHAEMFGHGGNLVNTYQPVVEIGSVGERRKGNDRYESEEKSIHGYIRKVGKGRMPSVQAVEYAKALGYDLEPDETYVRPFFKHVLRLKEKQPVA